MNDPEGEGGGAALTPLEVASNLVLGPAPGVDPLPEGGGAPRPTARQALEDTLARTLAGPACAVAFSGGRDSSAVLAVAAHVARSRGLPLPVPVTLRFRHVPDAAESEWQEAVVRHLRLPDWERVDLDDELDCIGPYARAVLRRHGVVWPFNAHFLAPLAEKAGGRPLLTGIGGDDLFLPFRWRRARLVLHGRVRPRLRDALRVGMVVAPPGARQAVLRRRATVSLPWLRPGTQRAVAMARARADAHKPTRWDRWVSRSWWPGRSRVTGMEAIDAVVADGGSVAVHPLEEPPFLTALAHEVGPAGFASRTVAMRQLFGDVLPEPVLSRSSKAAFNRVYWNHHSRAFAAAWDGSGVDEEVVDVPALRSMWSGDRPDGRTYLLLQSLWLQGSRATPAGRR